MASSSRKRSRIPVEEVSDSMTMTMILKRMHLNQVIMKNIVILMMKIPRKREVRLEKTVILRRNLKDKIMRMYDRGGGDDEQFRRLLFIAILNTNPPVNIPETELDFFQLYSTDNRLQTYTYTNITEDNRFVAKKIQKATPLNKQPNMA
ncbi:hypothetical protein JTB14_034329 [Gonioctena quinquepunctata]|nr:hypothetical protein JTB14_034329 [Gonioctena quinquepunctata]